MGPSQGGRKVLHVALVPVVNGIVPLGSGAVGVQPPYQFQQWYILLETIQLQG